jgi:hypothetical protein
VYILSNHQIQKLNIPDGFMPCWYVEDRARVNALLKNTPFVDLNSFPHNYFKITKRYDNKYVEGNLALIDSQKHTLSGQCVKRVTPILAIIAQDGQPILLLIKYRYMN